MVVVVCFVSAGGCCLMFARVVDCRLLLLLFDNKYGLLFIVAVCRLLLCLG